MRTALVTPLLKKPRLNFKSTQLQTSFNLSFVSKVLEKVAAARLLDHLTFHNLREPTQSAYRTGHSIDRTLLHVGNDILRAVDRGEAVILVLLDLSTTFDTTDHDVLLERIQHRIGIGVGIGVDVGGTALHWFRAYLRSRH